MKKYVWIAVLAFTLGLVTAGYVFVSRTDSRTPDVPRTFAKAPEPGLGSNLFASTAPEIRTSLDFASITEKVGPAVVKVSATRKAKINNPFGSGDGWPFDDFFDRFFGSPQPQPRQQEQIQTAFGTGFFISSDGYILTNNHIVEGAEQVEITTVQGDEYDAQVKGRDARTDIALLKVNIKNAPIAELGDSTRVRVGEWVLAIGNPYGMDNTVTAGIVSAKGRRLSTESQYEDFIQTDAAINRGNSGGPLINMQGQVIGITSIILAPTGGNIGIGFAIPSNIAMKVVEQLKAKGRVSRGHLGIAVQEITKGVEKQLNLTSRKGAVISSVEADSPADRAGLKQYDVITAVNGRPVENMNDCRFKIADIEPGKPVELTIVRDGKQIVKKAIADELDSEKAKSTAVAEDKDIGISLAPLNADVARKYGLKTTEGLLITEVVPGSEADRSGLQPGLIIIEVNRKKVATVREFQNLLKATEHGDEIILLVRAEGERSSQDTIITVKVR